MGCFLACFSSDKHRKRRHLVNVTHCEDQRRESSEVLQVTEWIKQADTEQPSSEAKEKFVQPSGCSSEKKATFDLNVKTDQKVSPEKVNVTDNFVKKNEKKESEKVEETPKEIKLDSDSTTPDKISHLPNHRYQNCASSEDEIADLDLDDGDGDGDGDGNGEGNGEDSDDKILIQEESSESLFSLSIDSRKQVCEVELGEKEVSSRMLICCDNQELEEIGLNRNARDRSQFVHSVLNPVENLTRWKVVKARATPPPSKYQDKENFSLVLDYDIPTSTEPNFKLSTRDAKLNSNNKKAVEQELAVDTSLSSWLVESETTPMSKTSTVSVGNSPSENANSFRSHEDKPILGALTVEDLKKLSASTPSRRSRSPSPEEPIIGTVGNYWKHTRKITDSDSGFSSQGTPKTRSPSNKDESVMLHSIPFESRLEEALDVGVAAS